MFKDRQKPLKYRSGFFESQPPESRKISTIGIAENISRHGPCRPIQHQQPLEVVISADVVAVDVAQCVLASAMGMATKDKWNALRIFRYDQFQSPIAGKRIPKEPIHRDG